MYLDPGHGSWGNLPKDPVHLKKKKKNSKKSVSNGTYILYFLQQQLGFFPVFHLCIYSVITHVLPGVRRGSCCCRQSSAVDIVKMRRKLSIHLLFIYFLSSIYLFDSFRK